MKKSFRTLYVWQVSIDLAVRVIALADSLIIRRRYVIADQLVRAALSIASNIAEGEGRATERDRRHFLVQARGSAYELETQLEIILRARLADNLAELKDMLAKITSGISKMIHHRDRSEPSSL